MAPARPIGARLRQKGQASIEFILLLAMILLLVHTITLPYIDIAQSATSDVVRVSQAKLAGQRVADAVSVVGSSGNDARQVFTVFVPPQSVIACDTDGKRLTYTVKLEITDRQSLPDPGLVSRGTCTCEEDPGDPNSERCLVASCTGTFQLVPDFACDGFNTDNRENEFSQICRVTATRTGGGDVELSSLCG